jgi:UDP-glucuronate 4-epimerase
VDDAVDAVVAALDRPAAASPAWDAGRPDRATSRAPFRLYDVGGGRPVELIRFVEALQAALGVTASLRFVGMASGEVAVTCADGRDLERELGVRPAVTVEDGLRRMAGWYRAWRGLGGSGTLAA